ncbi:hypothetical protein FOYG_09999 [Fusarium oxysporum NRRL 32931]|uniref:Uncharacterized protein n=1 Tax=Fusarium oxysporum NRRL 32931 TaxID=660029 RepID=W9I945_FUSOX|nr:hypothetical protein FOYG_09999 [Fusarium oxysporum NRRL 32931]
MASLCLGPASASLLFNTSLLFYYYLQYLMRSELPLCCDHGRLSYGNPATLLASACLTPHLQAHYRTSTGDCVFMVPLGDWNNKRICSFYPRFSCNSRCSNRITKLFLVSAIHCSSSRLFQYGG